MDICALLLGIGLTVLCPTPPVQPAQHTQPAQPVQPVQPVQPIIDPAAEELRAMQEEMARQERQADEKIDRLYRGLGDCPGCGTQRLDPKTLTRIPQ